VKTILEYDTVRLNEEIPALEIIDQTKLPGKIEILQLVTQESIWDAIYLLKVRGAPAIGVAAAIGIYLAAREITASDYETFFREFQKKKAYLNSARPTAVNLSWALERMEQVVCAHAKETIPQIVEHLHREAVEIYKEDIARCKKIGEHGLSLLKPGMGILTHCNAGKLATVRYGTATAPMYLGQENGYDFHIYCDETRPLLQGARLTAFELSSAGMKTTLICDNMAPTVMEQKKVQAVIVGADRIAANGDTANKIGTSYVALAAKHYHIPFYVCAPTSTIDLSCPDGDAIVIEERPAQEVTTMWYEKPMAPEEIDVFNPAFDVTDAQLISAIITENGVAFPPFTESLCKIRHSCDQK
jgi:methylthioribose-1-phosphate isomerase